VSHPIARCHAFDGLRFLAFAGVFVFHCDPRGLWMGAYGVHVFFALSGFLITLVLHSAGDTNPVRTAGIFYARRTLRIFPAYYTCLAVVLPLGTLAFPRSHVFYLFNVKIFLESLGGPIASLRDWDSSGIHFWSLCVEEQFYLVYPLILLAVPRTHRRLALAGLALTGTFSRFLISRLYPETYYGQLLPVCMEYLAWGGFAALVCERGFAPKISRATLAAGLAMTAALALLGIRPANALVQQFAPGFWQTARAVAFATLVAGIWVCRDSLVGRVLAWKPLAYLGRISYGLYLYHLFTWEAFARIQSKWPALSSVPPVAGRVALTLGAAMLSWHLLEKPVGALKDRFVFR